MASLSSPRPLPLTFAVAAFAVVASALVACAPARPAQTATTGADVAAPESREASSEVAAEAEAEAAPPAPERPAGMPGQLVCRSKDAFGVVTELHLAWEGAAGKGVLRRVAPSGMVSLEKVTAEREGGTIIADGPGAVDLVSHAAIVRQHEGKTYLRLGGGPPSLCE